MDKCKDCIHFYMVIEWKLYRCIEKGGKTRHPNNRKCKKFIDKKAKQFMEL